MWEIFKRKRVGRHPTFDDNARAAVPRLYTEGLSLEEVAKRTGVPKATVHRILIKQGIQLRPSGRPRRRA